MTYNEEKGNLFELPNSYSLVQCIAQNDNWKQGIVIQFAKNFKGLKNYCINQIKNNNLKAPCVIPYNNKDILIFNLVTKKKYNGKPNYMTVSICIEQMAMLCQEFNIKNIGLPKIACGLDGLNWCKIREIIKDKFKDIDIDIQVRYSK